MEDIFSQVERENKVLLKTEFTGIEKERIAKERAIKDGKLKYIPHPLEWMEHIGPYAGKRIDFSRSPICLLGSR